MSQKSAKPRQPSDPQAVFGGEKIRIVLDGRREK